MEQRITEYGDVFKWIYRELVEYFRLQKSENTSENSKFKKVYKEKQLENIKENWRMLSQFLKIFAFLAMMALGFASKSSSIFMVRTMVIGIFILFLSSFKGIVKRSELAAKYSGTIFSIVVIFGMTEINVNLGQYRLYEGFMVQVALSSLMSTCMSTNWATSTLCLLLSYVYFWVRMNSTFNEVPNELIIVLIEASVLYALGAYFNSCTLHRELLANFKTKQSSEEFKQFLKCLPEGVSIIDHERLELKFYNSKLRQTFDINHYCEFGSELTEFNNLKSSIDHEFNQALKKMKENSNKISGGNRPFKSLMKKFKIIKESDKASTGFLKKEECSFENADVNQSLANNQRVGSPSDISLLEFLHQERESLKRQNTYEKESKVAIYFDYFKFVGEIKMVQREFIIKTRSVSNNDPENQKRSLYLHIFIDTTQIRQLEEQRAQNKYQKQMLANVSHEFRTPLNAMSMSLMFLKDQVQGPPSKFLRIASTSCDILKHLVEDILDHAKIESGVFEIQEQVFKTNKLLDEVKDIFELQASQKKIKLIFLISEELENTRIKTDKQRIKQVLLNLVSNALKFTDRGSISISLKKVHHRREILEGREEDKEECKYDTYFNFQNGSVNNRMDSRYEYVNQEYTSRPQLPRVNKYSGYPSSNNVSNSEESDNEGIEPYRSLKLMLSVEDTGIGIPLSDQSSLFKLFGKTSSNHNRNKTGCGLGLTICRKILKKLGGDITLESEEGKGTKFTCIFECKY